jgi:hypothetical protein
MSGFDLWAWERAIFRDKRLTAADRHVALTIAHHMKPKSGDGAFPGIRLLAYECARKPQTVIDATRKLEASGYLKVKRDDRHIVSRDPNQYTATLPEGATSVPKATRRHVASSGAATLPEGAHEISKRERKPNDAPLGAASFGLDDCLGNCRTKHPVALLEAGNGWCPECKPSTIGQSAAASAVPAVSSAEAAA